METRDSDFNILLATDSYKVRRRSRGVSVSGQELRLGLVKALDAKG